MREMQLSTPVTVTMPCEKCQHPVRFAFNVFSVKPLTWTMVKGTGCHRCGKAYPRWRYEENDAVVTKLKEALVPPVLIATMRGTPAPRLNVINVAAFAVASRESAA